MKLERSVLKLEVYGETFEIKFPSYKQTQAYSESLKSTTGGAEADASTAMKNFLETLGLPGRVFDELEIDHIIQIMDAITKKK